jgi:hypothetical protein
LDTDVFFPLDTLRTLLAFADVSAEFPQAVTDFPVGDSEHLLKVLVFGEAISAIPGERGDFPVEEFGCGRQPFIGEYRPRNGDAVRRVGHGSPPMW